MKAVTPDARQLQRRATHLGEATAIALFLLDARASTLLLGEHGCYFYRVRVVVGIGCNASDNASVIQPASASALRRDLFSLPRCVPLCIAHHVLLIGRRGKGGLAREPIAAQIRTSPEAP